MNSDSAFQFTPIAREPLESPPSPDNGECVASSDRSHVLLWSGARLVGPASLAGFHHVRTPQSDPDPDQIAAALACADRGRCRSLLSRLLDLALCHERTSYQERVVDARGVVTVSPPPWHVGGVGRAVAASEGRMSWDTRVKGRPKTTIQR